MLEKYTRGGKIEENHATIYFGGVNLDYDLPDTSEITNVELINNTIIVKATVNGANATYVCVPSFEADAHPKLNALFEALDNQDEIVNVSELLEDASIFAYDENDLQNTTPINITDIKNFKVKLNTIVLDLGEGMRETVAVYQTRDDAENAAGEFYAVHDQIIKNMRKGSLAVEANWIGDYPIPEFILQPNMECVLVVGFEIRKLGYALDYQNVQVEGNRVFYEDLFDLTFSSEEKAQAIYQRILGKMFED